MKFASPFAYRTQQFHQQREEEKRQKALERFRTAEAESMRMAVQPDIDRLSQKFNTYQAQQFEGQARQALGQFAQQHEARTFQQEAGGVLSDFQKRHEERLAQFRQVEAEGFRTEAEGLIQKFIGGGGPSTIGGGVPQNVQAPPRPGSAAALAAPTLDFQRGVVEEAPNLVTPPNAGTADFVLGERTRISPQSALGLLERVQRGEFGDPNSPENVQRQDVLNTIVEGAPASALDLGFGSGGLDVKEVLTPLLPEEAVEPLRSVPVVGNATADVASSLTSPAALISLGVGGVAAGPATLARTVAAESVGSVGLGSAGYGLEAAGVPRVGTPLGPMGPAALGETLGGIRTVRSGVTASLVGAAQKAGAHQPGFLSRLINRVGQGTSIEEGFVRQLAETPPTQDPLLTSFATKMSTAFDEYQAQRPDVRAARTAEAGRRTAMANDILERELAKGVPYDEAQRLADQALAGEYPAFQNLPDFTPTTAETNAFYARLAAHPLAFERSNLYKAIQRWKNGDRIGFRPYEVKLAQKILGDDFADIFKKSTQSIRSQQPLVWRALQTTLDSFKLPQEILSSGDASWHWRQGGKVFWRNPVEWMDSLKKDLRAIVSESDAYEIDNAMRQDATPIPIDMGASADIAAMQRIAPSQIGQRVIAADRGNIGTIRAIDGESGVATVHFLNKQTGFQETLQMPISQLDANLQNAQGVTGAGKGVQTATLGDILDGRLGRGYNPEILADLSGDLAGQDLYRTSVGQRVPGVRQFERGFITAGNAMGANLFKKMLLADVAAGRPITSQTIKEYGNAVKRATSRGTLEVPGMGPNPVGQLAQKLMWAPGLRIAGPQFFLQIFHPNPQVRAFARQNLGMWALGNMATMGVMAALGAEVGLAPNSTDFGKVRFGDTRINLWGSDQVMVRTLMQLATDERYDAATGTTDVDPMSTVLRYFQSGSDPLVRMAIEASEGRNYIGEDVDLSSKEGILKYLSESLIPLGFQEVRDMWLNQGPLAAIGASPFILTGVNVASYSKPSEQRAERYNQAVRDGLFGPDAQLYKDEDKGVRSANIAAHPELFEGIETSAFAAERNDILQEQANSLGLDAIASRVVGGQRAAGPDFVDAIQDFRQNRAAIIAADFYGEDADDPKTEIGKKLQAYRDIQMSDEKYVQSDGSIDRDAFFSDLDEAFSKLPQELQDALSTPVRTLSPEAQQVEQEYNQARIVRNQLYEQPKWAGLSKAKADALIDFERRVSQTQQRLKREASLAGASQDVIDTITLRVVAIAMASKNKSLDNLAALALLDFKGDLPINEERLQFAIDNQDILATYFPDVLGDALPVGVERSQLVSNDTFELLNR